MTDRTPEDERRAIEGELEPEYAKPEYALIGDVVAMLSAYIALDARVRGLELQLAKSEAFPDEQRPVGQLLRELVEAGRRGMLAEVEDELERLADWLEHLDTADEVLGAIELAAGDLMSDNAGEA